MMTSSHVSASPLFVTTSPPTPVYEETTEYDGPNVRLYSTKVEYLMALKVALCLLGLVCNSLTIRAFLRMGLQDNVTIVFFNLAISDLNIVNVFLAKLGAALSEYAPVQVFNSFRAHPNGVMQICINVFEDTFVIASIYLTTFLAVQRCMCVVKPFHFKGMFSRFRTVAIMMAIWTLCVANGLKSLFFFKVVEERRENRTSSWISIKYSKIFNEYIAYSELIHSSLIGACQASIVVSIILMARALKQSAKFRYQASTSSFKAQGDKDTNRPSDVDGTCTNGQETKTKISYRERQVIIQVSLVSAILFFAHAHTFFFELVWQLFPQVYQAPGFWDRYFFYRQVRDLLVLFNSGVNFFIYYKFNSKFKQVCFQKKA